MNKVLDIKGTVSVISIDPPIHTTAPLGFETFFWSIMRRILSFSNVWKGLIMIIPIFFPAVEER